MWGEGGCTVPDGLLADVGEDVGLRFPIQPRRLQLAPNAAQLHSQRLHLVLHDAR